jgi:hypothetical protein
MQKKTIEQIQIRRPWQSDNVCTLALLDIAMLAKKKIKKWIYLCHKGERHIQTSPTPSLNIFFLLSTSAILEFSELFYSVSPPFTETQSSSNL